MVDDHGPFTFDERAAYHKRIEAAAEELLQAARAAGEIEMAGKVMERGDPSLPEDSVLQRTATSLGIQALHNAAIDAKHDGFNIIDGWAHGLAAILAQKPETVRVAAQNLMFAQLRGYIARTTRAMDPRGAAGRG